VCDRARHRMGDGSLGRRCADPPDPLQRRAVSRTLREV